jgi:hypothetical protein
MPSDEQHGDLVPGGKTEDESPVARKADDADASDVAVGSGQPVVGGRTAAAFERCDGGADFAPEVGAQVAVVLAADRREPDIEGRRASS